MVSFENNNVCDLNVKKNAIEKFSKDEILDVYRKIYMVREFEQSVIQAVEEKKISYQVYLSLGQEAVAAAISESVKDALIFAQHRAHDLYLCVGGDPYKLKDELLGLETGSSGGRAGSNCLQIHENGIEMFGHHGLIGENVPQAVGAALGSGKKTLCVFGDGSAEEDYIYPSIGFAITHNLPVLFLCIDNDLSVLTPVKDRRNWDIVNMAKGMGVRAADLADCPWTIKSVLQKYTWDGPMLINCKVCRERWHVGIGIDGKRTWERNVIVRDQIADLGLGEELNLVEDEVKELMRDIWSGVINRVRE